MTANQGQPSKHIKHVTIKEPDHPQITFDYLLQRVVENVEGLQLQAESQANFQPIQLQRTQEPLEELKLPIPSAQPIKPAHIEEFQSARPEQTDIQTREQELMQRAKALELEMEAIKKAKLEAVLSQFEQQL